MNMGGIPWIVPDVLPLQQLQQLQTEGIGI